MATFFAVLSAIGAALKAAGVWLGLVRDKQLRVEGAKAAQNAQDKATLDAVRKSNEIESRPKPTTPGAAADRL